MVSRIDHKIVNGQLGRTVYTEARGHDAQAPVAEFGEKITVHDVEGKRSNSGPKVDARLHDGIRLGLRMKSDESIIGTPNGVIKAKTARRLPVDQRWRTEEVLSKRGIPSNPVPSTGKDNIPTEVKGTKHAERGEDEHAPARKHKKCDVRTTVVALEPTVRRMYVTRTHTRECPTCKGIESDRSTRRIEERGTEARSAP